MIYVSRSDISVEDFKQLISKTFNCEPEDVHFSEWFLEFTPQYEAVFFQIQHLGRLYNLRNIKTNRIIFESDDYYGVTTRYTNGGQNFGSINLGDLSYSASLDKGFCKVKGSQIYKYIVTHEFAHVITSSNGNASEALSEQYWAELEPIFQKYRVNVDLGIQKPFSDYSCEDINEFHAEAFTSYHLGAEPSDVVLKVGKLIDKYFKK